LIDANVHVYDNDIYYGDGVFTKAIAVSNSVITFRRINLDTLYIKNKTAGSNGRVVIVGVIE